jgi:hypothetical protein
MIAAGVNAEAITRYLGHSSIEVPFDRYGRLMPETRPRPWRSSTPTSSERTRWAGSRSSTSLPESVRLRARETTERDPVRQSCVSEHRNQRTFTDFGLDNHEYDAETAC